MTAKAQGNKGGDALINIEQVQTSGENKMRNMAATKERAEELAFVYWQLNVNDEAYENNLITKAMCEFARDELLKRIDRLSESRYIEAVNGWSFAMRTARLCNRGDACESSGNETAT